MCYEKPKPILSCVLYPINTAKTNTHTQKTHEENCEICANGFFLGEIIITQVTKFGVLVSQL